jgi:ADP-heptose:LPS heptosyltransferase
LCKWDGKLLRPTAKFNLSELVDELQDYDIVLSGDTGPMHMAAALALPQIALLGVLIPLGFQTPKSQSTNIIC